MSWSIRHRYDKTGDFMHVEFKDVVLATPADVDRWRAEVEEFYKPIGRKLNVLINLDGLALKPSAASAFARARAYINGKYHVRVYRYSGNVQTRTTLLTGAVHEKADVDVYASYDEALSALQRDRAATE
jgi:hypothetical protein